MADNISKVDDIELPELVINDIDSIATYNEMVAEGLVKDNQLYLIAGQVNHNTLAGTSNPDSHPMSAITGLSATVTELSTSISNATRRISTLEAQQTALANSVAGKADKTYVDEALSEKADSGVVASELNKKANKTDVDTALAEKVNITTFNTEISKKADSDAVTSALAGKVDTTTFTERLAEKADQSDLTALQTTVSGKVDNTTYEAAINEIQTQIDALSNYSSSLQLLIMGVA